MSEKLRTRWSWSALAALSLLAASGCGDQRKPTAFADGGFQMRRPAIDLVTWAQRAGDARSSEHAGLLAEGDIVTLRAAASLTPTQGSQVGGQLSFLQQGGHVHITGFLANLSPGLHGFHIHENGDCSAADAASAGAHFSPGGGHPHGAPSNPPAARHAGDLGNIEADANGVAAVDIDDSTLTLVGEAGVLGRAVIVHAQPDDLTSQPAGNAGDRVACGVILQNDSLALVVKM